MLVVDVNVLVSAFFRQAPDHEQMRTWLAGAVADREPLGVSDVACVGAVRVLTHRRVFDPPTPLPTALDQVAALRGNPGVLTLVPGPRHWVIVDELCRAGAATANLVADAGHAAVGVEQGATWISKDRDFARFPGLRWRHPLDG